MTQDQDIEKLRKLAAPHFSLYLFGITLSFLIMGISIYFSYTNWDIAETNGISVGALAAAGLTLWFVLSLRSLKNTVFGAAFLFGKPALKMSGGGLWFVPLGIFQVHIIPAVVMQIQLPGEPEDVQKTSDKEPLRVAIIEIDGKEVARTKVRPIRITTKRPGNDTGANDDPLNTQLTITPSFWYRWHVVDPFLYELALGSEAGAAQNLRDKGETILTQHITKMTPAELTSSFKDIQDAFEAESKKDVAEWGIAIEDSGLVPFDYGKAIAVTLDNIGIAKGEVAIATSAAAKTIIAAEAEKTKRTLEGEGDGAAEESIRAGRGRGIQAIAKVTRSQGAQTVLAAEVAENTIGKGDVIIGTDGIQQVLGIGKKMMERKEDAL